MMRDAVETVAPNAVALRHRGGQCVVRGVIGQALMKGGIEHRDVRDRAEGAARRPDDADGGGIVQWRQLAQRVDRCDGRIIESDRCCKLSAAMHDTVTDRVDGGRRAAGPQLGERELRRVDVRVNGQLSPQCVTICVHEGERRSTPNPFNSPARTPFGAGGGPAGDVKLDQLKFQRRTAAIEDENSHRQGLGGNASGASSHYVNTFEAAGSDPTGSGP